MSKPDSSIEDHVPSKPETVNRDTRPLRILCLNYEFPPMGGGAGNATQQTAQELGDLGHTVHVLTSRLPGQPKIQQYGPVTVFRVFSPRRSIHECGWIGAGSYVLSGFFRQIRLARKFKYDIYHYYFGLPTGSLALYPCLFLRKPYVVSLRGSDVPGYDRTRKYLQPLHRVLRPVLRCIWNRATYVVALSQNLRSLAHNVSPTTDIGIIHNGIDTDMFPRKNQVMRIASVRLICVCRLVPRKGLKFLIEAMRDLGEDGITLEIVGAGDSENELRQFVSRLELDSTITFSGYVPRANLSRHYREADIFVLPSISESFGQVLLEAMSCGLPIIATRAGGIPETVEHGTNGLLVEPGSSKDLVSAVRELAANPAIREKMGKCNGDRARTEYTWSAVAAEYNSMFQHAVSQGNRLQTARKTGD